MNVANKSGSQLDASDSSPDCGCATTAASAEGLPCEDRSAPRRRRAPVASPRTVPADAVDGSLGTTYATQLPTVDASQGTQYALPDSAHRQPVSIRAESERAGGRDRRRKREIQREAARPPRPTEIQYASKAGTPALDTVISLKGGAGNTLRELFRLMRARGITPHALGEAQDEAIASILLKAVPTADNPAKGEPAGQGDVLGSIVLGPGDFGDRLATETSVGPDAVFGVAEGMFPRDPGFDGEQRRQTGVFGDYADMIADIADMGVGRVRRLKYGDIQWGSIFPRVGDPEDSYQSGEKVFPPEEILRRLRADGYAVLDHVGLMLLAAMRCGLRLSLTPFHAGGGSSYFGVVNEAGNMFVPAAPPAPFTWNRIAAARADHHDGIALPSSLGWDEFYWDLPVYRTRVAQDDLDFQQYCINVWPVLRPSSGDTVTREYTRECARRKGLGITAFCTGIAEYLDTLEMVVIDWTDGGLSLLTETIEFIELGNEIDGLFKMPWRTEEELDGRTVTERVIREMLAQDGAGEAGRYMALIAGPFRRLLPGLKFRASELASTAPEVVSRARCEWFDVLEGKADWLRDAIERGLAWEVEHWDEIQRALQLFAPVDSYLSPDHLDWFRSCEAAGWYWPPLAFSESTYLNMRAQDLVHEVGFHWFHGFDTGSTNIKEEYYYFDAAKLAADIDLFRAFVVEPLEDGGFTLGLSIGSITFSARWPEGAATEDVRSPYYAGTSEEMQAAMLVRLLSVARAEAVDHVYWFNHMLKPLQANGVWGSPVAGTGLHNDVRPLGITTSRFQERAACPRPVWFAYRRLVWLFEHSYPFDLSTPVNTAGRTAVRIRLRPRISTGPDGTRFSHAYKYAWILWIDQYADSDCMHPGGDDPAGSAAAEVHLSDSGGVGYQLLSLVPTTNATFRPIAPTVPVDANGYMAVDSVDWNWPGWDAACVASAENTNPAGGHRIRMWIRRADPAEAIAPVCILTDAARIEFP